jgi:hypothetical protein
MFLLNSDDYLLNNSVVGISKLHTANVARASGLSSALVN